VSIAERRAYQAEIRGRFAEDGIHDNEPTCRECGCSDSLACPDGCWWVEADLCSACAVELESLPPPGAQLT
jgi:hypothetical protein